LLHQRTKDLYFTLLSKATLPNYYAHRFRAAIFPRNGTPVHLHLGCGPNYLPGFLNIDANPQRKVDLWLDVRNGLPFPDGTVTSIYSTHMLEHLYHDELGRLFAECWRVLQPGGGVRFIVPNLETAITAYLQRENEWFDDYPRRLQSLGGRFANFIFCDGQHRTTFDYGHLRELLEQARFERTLHVQEGESTLYQAGAPAYAPADRSDLAHSLYVEAFKPESRLAV
jgi:predicted SAM-dependent methyltransferase